MLGIRDSANKANLIFIYFALAVMLITMLSCRINIPVDVNAREPKIGFEINQENGRVRDEVLIVPASAQRIYFEFFLDTPENVKVSLEFKWYYDSELIFSSKGIFPRGYTVAFIENIQEFSPAFSHGSYTVEVWFLDKLLISKSFRVE